jgi:hypothetical protein
MSVLASLVRAYERMGSDGPAFGYARLDVSFSIRIDRNGKTGMSADRPSQPFRKGAEVDWQTTGIADLSWSENVRNRSELLMG